MILFHLCNNWVSSRVHYEVCEQLRLADTDQVVFVPYRKISDLQSLDDKNKKFAIEFIKFKNHLRYFPLLKVIYIFLKCRPIIIKRINDCESKPKFIGHSFWSDGMVLFLLSLFYEIEYSLVVRNTDINIFIPRLPQYRWLMAKSIKRSNGLVFISQAHFNRFKKNWPKLLSFSKKTAVIPNGINEYWHSNLYENSKMRPMQACFVGRFDKNKNLVQLLQACATVSEQIKDFKLIIAGGTEGELKRHLKTDRLPPFVDVRGQICSNDKLRDIYRTSRVFVMPSISETFGLVYLEALSQGCSLVYTKNEGIDGLFNSPYIIAVNPQKKQEIAGAILKLMKYSSFGIEKSFIEKKLPRYRWSRVASDYLEFLQ